MKQNWLNKTIVEMLVDLFESRRLEATFGKMLITFPYIDAVIVDTPISDVKVRSQIRDVHSIEDRIKRIEVFQQYLNSCWPFTGN